MKKALKIVATLILLMIIIQNTSVFANVVNIGETKYVSRGTQGDYTVMYYDSNWDEWFYIGYSQTYYTDDYGNTKIAYCNTPDLDGVGWLPGEYSGYDTTVERKLSNDNELDKKLWRVFKNGYPYSSLNVECDDDAYLATKQAAYFMIKGRSEDEVYSYFKPNEEDEWLKNRGKKVIDEIYRLVCIGNHGDEEMNEIRVDKIGEIANSEKDENISFQEYEVIGKNGDGSIEIYEITGSPLGTFITDVNGNPKNTFLVGEHFRINYYNDKIDGEYNVKVAYKATCENYPVFLSASSIENTQNYLLSAEKMDDTFGEIELYIDPKKCNFEILKLDENTDKPIPGVTFEIKYKNGEEIGTYTTDEEGMIRIANLKPEEIIVTEIDAPTDYIINSTPREFNLYYNGTILVEIDNKEAKPEIKIDKQGPETVKPSDEIMYNFSISNNGNVPLENFTWYDYLPYDKAKITKIATGTYNQELNYNVYYKTDAKNEYILLKENLNTQSNNFINLADINLQEGENITEIKFDFGTVDINFQSLENPYFYLKVKECVEGGDEIINNTRLEGEYRKTKIKSEDSVKTVIETQKQIITENKKLPRTGF